MFQYKLLLEYRGCSFAGSQKQDNIETVQSVLEGALENLTQEKVSVIFAGRTDAGVHAIAQVCHFFLSKDFKLIRMQQGLNYFLKRKRVGVYEVNQIPLEENFHARFSAKYRSYIYKVLNRDYPPTFNKHLCWWVPYELDIENMQECAEMIKGTHDFTTFRARGCQAKTAIKTLNEIRISKTNQEVEIFLEAKSFIYKQVRNIVGALVYVGGGKWSVEDFATAFDAKDRTKGAITAPAYGLYFDKVKY